MVKMNIFPTERKEVLTISIKQSQGACFMRYTSRSKIANEARLYINVYNSYIYIYPKRPKVFEQPNL